MSDVHTAQLVLNKLAPAFPSVTRELFDHVHSDPALLQHPANLTPFLAAPWLLPAGSEKLLPYYGRGGNLEQLLRVQALPDPLGQSRGLVTLLYFNYQQAAMAMNCIYSLVKFGGVTSYVVVVWNGRSREACAHLNLPCFDASAWLPARVADTEAKYGDPNFIAIMWLRTQFARHVLKLGYTIHVSDVDLAYAPYNLHRSLLAYIHEVNATGTFPGERPVNTGSYMLLPSPRGLALMDAWVAEGQRLMARGLSEQEVLCRKLNGTAYQVCEEPKQCDWAARQLAREEGGEAKGIPGSDESGTVGQGGATGNVSQGVSSPIGGGGGGSGSSSMALLRTFPTPRARDLGGFREHVHPCGYPLLFWHATGVTGQQPKVDRLQRLGYWFIDDERCWAEKGRAHLVRCPLRLWRDEWVEGDFLKCDRSRLGLQYFRLPKGLSRRGVVGPLPHLTHYAAFN
ncbi:hypothetical protein N2152v2_001698 [Parachlorella kessleri]